MRILIADDDSASRAMLEALVGKFGHTAVLARDGNETLEILKETSAPRIVILDWLMPGPDGEEICRFVRSMKTETPPYIIMLTIKGEKDDIVRGLDAGANDYLPKPYDPAELRARINVGIRMLDLEADLANRIVSLEINEKKIQTLLAEKEIILYEVHHRIKNNMAMIVNLLTMQAETFKDPLAVSTLQNAIGRVKSMGLLYDRLYRSDDLSAMSLRKYLPPLIDEILNVFPDRYRIDLDIDVADMPVDVQKLACLGMIVNELVFNAMKYAFVGRETGTITVDAFRTGDMATVVFADDGCGIPDSVNIKTPESFGLRLVVGLTAQMGGKLALRVDGGTRYTIEFAVP